MLHDGGEQSSWSCLFENNLNSSNEFYLRSNNSSNDNNNYHKSTARYTTYNNIQLHAANEQISEF